MSSITGHEIIPLFLSYFILAYKEPSGNSDLMCRLFVSIIVAAHRESTCGHIDEASFQSGILWFIRVFRSVGFEVSFYSIRIEYPGCKFYVCPCFNIFRSCKHLFPKTVRTFFSLNDRSCFIKCIVSPVQLYRGFTQNRCWQISRRSDFVVMGDDFFFGPIVFINREKSIAENLIQFDSCISPTSDISVNYGIIFYPVCIICFLVKSEGTLRIIRKFPLYPDTISICSDYSNVLNCFYTCFCFVNTVLCAGVEYKGQYCGYYYNYVFFHDKLLS